MFKLSLLDGTIDVALSLTIEPLLHLSELSLETLTIAQHVTFERFNQMVALDLLKLCSLHVLFGHGRLVQSRLKLLDLELLTFAFHMLLAEHFLKLSVALLELLQITRDGLLQEP